MACILTLMVSACTTSNKPQISPSYILVDTLAANKKTFPKQHWEKISSPDNLGWNQKKLSSATRWWKLSGSAAGVAVHNGRIIHTWGDVSRKYRAHSIRKTFLESLYGIYYDKNKINLDATLAQLNIDDIYSLTKTEKSATVKQLLKGRSGVYHSAAYEVDLKEALTSLESTITTTIGISTHNWLFLKK